MKGKNIYESIKEQVEIIEKIWKKYLKINS